MTTTFQKLAKVKPILEAARLLHQHGLSDQKPQEVISKYVRENPEVIPHLNHNLREALNHG